MPHYRSIVQSVAPIRKEPAHQAEMISQVLFGSQVLIEQQVGQWFRITVCFDGTTGWLEQNYVSLTEVSKQYSLEMILTTSGTIRSAGEDAIIGLPLQGGTAIPKLNNSRFELLGKTWELTGGNVIPIEDEGSVARILHTAERFSGTPYLWGGITPAGFDAPGFVQTVFRISGIPLPRFISPMMGKGTEIHFLHDTLPGDLAFFSNQEDEEITHVGIVISQNQIIHAFGKVRTDTLDSQGIFNRDTGVYTHRLRIIKRLITHA